MALLQEFRSFHAVEEREKAEQIVHLLLDYPAQALRLGGSRKKREAWLNLASTKIMQVAKDIAAGETCELDVDMPEARPNKCAAPTDEHEAAARRAVAEMGRRGPGRFQRAAKALKRGGLALLNEDTFKILTGLHPLQAEPMGPLPVNGAPDVASLEKVLPDVMKRIDNGAAPGVSGWTGNHLAMVWKRADKQAREGLHMLLRDLCNGAFSAATRERLLTCRLIPLSKKDRGVRPIAVAEVITKAAAMCALKLVDEEIPGLFPCIQYAVKRPGGAETAAHLTRNLLREHTARRPETTVALVVDFRNAFNCVTRKAMWEALQRHPRLAPVLKPFYSLYSEASPLLVYDGDRLVHEVSSQEGGRQGDLLIAELAFPLTVQPLYEAALAAAQPGLVDGVAYQDDFKIVGEASEVLKVFDHLRKHAKELGLEVRLDKSAVYVPPLVRQSIGPAGLERLQGTFEAAGLKTTDALEALGVLHGSEGNIKQYCEDAVDSCEFFFECLELMPAQHASLLLRHCQLPRLGYLARTVAPRLLADAAKRFDRRAVECFMRIHGLTQEDLVALAGDESGPAQVTAAQLQARIELPESMGGMGMRSVKSVLNQAYFASALEALPELIRLRKGFRGPVVQAPGVDKDGDTIMRDAGAQERMQDKKQVWAYKELHALRVLLAAELATAGVPDAAHAPAMEDEEESDRPPSALAVVRGSTDDIWRFAAAKAKESEADPKVASQPFACARKLQHSLTASLEAARARKLDAELKPLQRSIVGELKEAAGSGAWMQALPCDEAYCLSDEDYRLAARKRLGMLPHSRMATESCLSCLPRNRNLPEFRTDPHHSEACLQHTAVSVTQRHNMIVNTVAGLARAVGAQVRIEPGLGHALVPERGPDGSAELRAKSSNKRGDLLIIKGGERTIVDVTVRRCTAPTNRAKGVVPGEVVAEAEKEKEKMYGKA